MASPDINTEDFSAAVDFLSLHPLVDQARIGILGICGWGGIALNAAANDPRIKATVASTMYDMTRIMGYGYNDTMTTADRRALPSQLAAQRLEDLSDGRVAHAGGVIDPLPDDAPQFINAKFLQFTDEIQEPVLVIHGSRAHSLYFGQDAFNKLRGENKELMIIPDATHTDLYYRVDVIPFETINRFFTDNLGK